MGLDGVRNGDQCWNWLGPKDRLGYYQFQSQRTMQRRKSSLRTVQRQSTTAQNIGYSDSSSRKLSCRERYPLSAQKLINSISTQITAKKHSPSLIQTLQQLQKKATQDFYNKSYDQAFNTLGCCQQLNGRLASIQHRVYIHYLYIEFYCKLKQYSKSFHHYFIAKQIYLASASAQQQKLKNYIINIQCLHITMLYQMKEYSEVIKSLDGFLEDLEKGSQQWFKCEGMRLKSCMNVERFEEAIIIAEQLAKFSGSESERYKFTLKIIQCFIKLNQPENAIDLLEYYLKEAGCEKQGDILNKLSEICLQTGDTIKSIYYLEKLVVFSEYKTDGYKLLSRLYFEVGDWVKLEDSLSSLDALVNLNFEEMHLLAQAKYYLGDATGAIDIYNDVLEKSTQKNYRLKAYLQLSKLSPNPLVFQSPILKECNNIKSEQSYNILREYISVLILEAEFQNAEYLFESALSQTTLQKYPNLHYQFLRDFGGMLEELDRKNESQVCYNRANKIRRISVARHD